MIKRLLGALAVAGLLLTGAVAAQQSNVTNAVVIAALQAMGLFGDGYATGQVPVWSATASQYQPGAPVPAYPLINPSFTGQMTGPTSTCAAPSYSATGQLTTGIAITATPSILNCISGTAVTTLTATGWTSTVPLLGPNGSSTAPTFSFSGETTKGFYSTASNGIGVTVAAYSPGPAAQFGSTALNLGSSYTLAWASGIAATNASDVILAREGANYLIQRNSTSAQRFSVANTYTSATNNELFSVDWQTASGNALVGTRTAATGTSRSLRLAAQTGSGNDAYGMVELQSGAPFFRQGASNAAGSFAGSTGGTGNFVEFGRVTSTSTSGSVVAFAILPTYNQATGTAANTDLLINRTETAIGSGTQLLIDAQRGGASQFTVSRIGTVTTIGGFTYASTGTAMSLTGGSNTGTLIAGGSPTVPVACTSPTVTWRNGTGAFQIDVGTTCAGISTLAVTMPAAANAWVCTAMNVTTSATAAVEMTASTTTSATFTNYTRTTGVALAWVDGADVRISCLGG